MEIIIKEIMNTVGDTAVQLIKIILVAVVAAIGKALTDYANSKTQEQSAKSMLADHETKKSIATDVAIAMSQSPDHKTNEEMKQGAVDVLAEKMPNETNETINSYAELGVATKKALDTSAAETPSASVDLSVKTTGDQTA